MTIKHYRLELFISNRKDDRNTAKATTLAHYTIAAQWGRELKEDEIEALWFFFRMVSATKKAQIIDMQLSDLSLAQEVINVRNNIKRGRVRVTWEDWPN